MLGDLWKDDCVSPSEWGLFQDTLPAFCTAPLSEWQSRRPPLLQRDRPSKPFFIKREVSRTFTVQAMGGACSRVAPPLPPGCAEIALTSPEASGGVLFLFVPWVALGVYSGEPPKAWELQALQ